MLKELSSERINVDSLEEALELYYERGWTDGLPAVPATENKVMDFLEYLIREADQILGEIPERDQVITAEKLAINAIMAGCNVEYMPVL